MPTLPTINLPSAREALGAAIVAPAGVATPINQRPGIGETLVVIGAGQPGLAIVELTFVGGGVIQVPYQVGTPLGITVASPVLSATVTPQNDAQFLIWRAKLAPQTALSFDESGQ